VLPARSDLEVENERGHIVGDAACGVGRLTCSRVG
jgi:hypothetical protein